MKAEAVKAGGSQQSVWQHHLTTPLILFPFLNTTLINYTSSPATPLTNAACTAHRANTTRAATGTQLEQHSGQTHLAQRASAGSSRAGAAATAATAGAQQRAGAQAGAAEQPGSLCNQSSGAQLFSNRTRAHSASTKQPSRCGREETTTPSHST